MWRALVGPAGLSAEVVSTIDAAMSNVLSNPEYLAAALKSGTFAEFKDNAEFSKYYEENHKFYQKLIKEAKLAK